MDWLNYHHLLYFHTVVSEGSIVKAAERLSLTPPTISGQIKALEDAIGERLFERQRRRLVLTEMGRTVHRYADEIFGIGRELLEAIRARPAGRPARLVVGVADVMPKLIVRRVLEPVLHMPGGMRLVCREDTSEKLLAALALHELDVVLTDAPMPPDVRVRAYNHLLGESRVTLFALPALARSLARRFPASLDEVPLLLPTPQSTLRRSIDQFFAAHRIRPRVVAEFDDSALLKVFGEDGVGVFPAPSVLERDICDRYGVKVVGRLPDVSERFYAISVERRLTHPAVVAMTQQARTALFHDEQPRG